MSSSAGVIRRALLYVPGSSPKMLAKAQTMGVDSICFDLEDSVTANSKVAARQHVQELLRQPKGSNMKEYAVRINAIGTGLEEDDLKAVCDTPALDTIVIPKANSASDVRWTADFIGHYRSQRKLKDNNGKTIKLLALIESAQAVMDLRQLCQSSPSLDGLIFAAEDFAHDLSITRTPSLTEFLYARSAIVTAARAHNLSSSIDLVCTSLPSKSDASNDGSQRMEEECIDGKRLGFNGKQCIHPSQVDVAHRCFAPSEAELDWAVRIVVADEKAQNMGKGAWALDGSMVDMPVVKKARAIVERATTCDLDVSSLRVKWRDQGPE